MSHWHSPVRTKKPYVAIDLLAKFNTEVQKGYGKHEWEISIKDLSDQIQMVSMFFEVAGANHSLEGLIFPRK